MDVLKIFNTVVCGNKTYTTGVNLDLVNLFIVPAYILIPNNKFAVLAYITIFIFWVLIYSSQSVVVKKVTADKHGYPSWLNALFSAFLLYLFQTAVILVFLKYTICERTLEWEHNDYHLTVQQYNTENFDITDGY